jgi:anti-sigma factor RsiW
MKACEAIQEDLPGYAAERLSSRERAPIEGHLRTCTTCQTELASLVRLERLLSSGLPVVETSPTLRSRFANRLAAELEAEEAEAAKRHGLFGWLTRPWLVPAIASGAVAIVVLVQSTLGPSPSESLAPTHVAKAPAPAERAKGPEVSVAKVEAEAPAQVASLDEPKEPAAGVPPEVEQDPELFVDFAIIEELDTLQTDGSEESAG